MAIFPNLCVPDERDLSTGSNYNPRNTSMYSCGYNFRLPPLKVRDLRLDLGKNISFSDSLLDGIVFGQALNVRYQAL